LRPATLTLLGLNLLLLLDHVLGAFGRYRRDEITPLRQPQPSLRHMREGEPRIPVAESRGHLEALLCAAPILVCPTCHDPVPVRPPDHNASGGILVQVNLRTEHST